MTTMLEEDYSPESYREADEGRIVEVDAEAATAAGLKPIPDADPDKDDGEKG